MTEIKLILDPAGPTSFDIYDEGGKQGEMIFGIEGKDMTIYHTEVHPESEGKGYAKMLLNAMVDYVRKEHLMVIPMCPYVHAQFERHPDQYADIWNKIDE